ncbi:MAG TPA: protein kinase [Gaiellaceae bacterium]
MLVGRYELLERVGEGGMGVVWRAHDEKLERDVAIKLLRTFVAHEPEQRRRFDREARTLAALSNDHIVRVYDYVDTGEQVFLVMEYVDGGNLAATTFGRLPLTVAEAAAYAAPVARALAYAHARGVVHRDLTPANILIERATGRVVTTDFGLARIVRSAGSVTSAEILVGTPEYWSPEQATGRDSDGAADVYALGCILFQLVSGRLPFEGEDRLAVGLRRAHEDAPSLRERLPGARADAVALVDSLLEREPARRPDASAVAAALAALLPSRQARLLDASPSASRSAAPTLALPAQSPTVLLPWVTAPTVRTDPPPRRRRRRRAMVAFAAAVATITAALVLAEELREPVVRAPNVVALRESVARAQILHRLPGATVAVTRVYSTRVAAGRVMSQRPRAREPLRNDALVRLTVSQGTPFAAVPVVATGQPANAAKLTLTRSGFAARYRYTPSWTVRKGTVIELRPGAGTRLRRPATVKIVVASGYPRAVVPDVENADLASAQTELEGKHLRYHVVYRLARNAPVNQVLGQIPAAGATVYSGTRVRLTVARTLRWVSVLSRSGTDFYESDPFTVPEHWRIRYRLDPGDFATPLAQISWTPDGGLWDGSFIAHSAGQPRTYAVGRAGTYRLAVRPFAGTAWHVEVQALE